MNTPEAQDEVVIYDIKEWLACPSCGARDPNIKEFEFDVEICCTNCLGEARVQKSEVAESLGLLTVADAKRAIDSAASK